MSNPHVHTLTHWFANKGTDRSTWVWWTWRTLPRERTEPRGSGCTGPSTGRWPRGCRNTASPGCPWSGPPAPRKSCRSCGRSPRLASLSCRRNHSFRLPGENLVQLEMIDKKLIYKLAKRQRHKKAHTHTHTNTHTHTYTQIQWQLEGLNYKCEYTLGEVIDKMSSFNLMCVPPVLKKIVRQELRRRT